jgi:hypothetical protein
MKSFHYTIGLLLTVLLAGGCDADGPGANGAAGEAPRGGAAAAQREPGRLTLAGKAHPFTATTAAFGGADEPADFLIEGHGTTDTGQPFEVAADGSGNWIEVHLKAHEGHAERRLVAAPYAGEEPKFVIAGQSVTADVNLTDAEAGGAKIPARFEYPAPK